MATKEFLQAVRRATAPKGVVASNIFWAAENRLHDEMVHTYQDVFGSVYIVATKYGPNEIVRAIPALYYREGGERRAADALVLIAADRGYEKNLLLMALTSGLPPMVWRSLWARPGTPPSSVAPPRLLAWGPPPPQARVPRLERVVVAKE